MKTFKILAGIIIIPLTICLGLIFLQNRNIKIFMIDYWFPPKGKTINNYDIIKCDHNIFLPKMAFVSDQVILDEYPEMAIYFSKMKNTFFGKISENYLGATVVTNITFPELVKMVKEDCEQFQEGYIDLTGYENYNSLSYEEQGKIWPEVNAKNLGWSYTPYRPEPEEPELTEEEKIQQEALEEKMRQETIERRAKRVPIEDLYK